MARYTMDCAIRLKSLVTLRPCRRFASSEFKLAFPASATASLSASLTMGFSGDSSLASTFTADGILRKAESRGATVIMGGIHRTVFSDEPLEMGADTVVTGNGALSYDRLRTAGSTATAGEDRRTAGETCTLLLAAPGRGAPGFAGQRIFETHALARRAQIDERAHTYVTAIRGGSRHAHHPLPVNFVAEENVSPLHSFKKVAQARSACESSLRRPSRTRRASGNTR